MSALIGFIVCAVAIIAIMLLDKRWSMLLGLLPIGFGYLLGVEPRAFGGGGLVGVVVGLAGWMLWYRQRERQS